MSESAKHQPYKYSLKTVTFINGSGSGIICSDGIIMYPIPPDNALTIENLRMKLYMQFESAIPSDLRVLKKVGIIDTPVSPTFFPSLVNRLRTFDVNIQADVNRFIEYEVDLTALLKKDDIAYRGLFNDSSSPENGYTMVYIGFDESLRLESNIGTVIQWKIDALFTTVGIV